MQKPVSEGMVGGCISSTGMYLCDAYECIHIPQQPLRRPPFRRRPRRCPRSPTSRSRSCRAPTSPSPPPPSPAPGGRWVGGAGIPLTRRVLKPFPSDQLSLNQNQRRVVSEDPPPRPIRPLHFQPHPSLLIGPCQRLRRRPVPPLRRPPTRHPHGLAPTLRSRSRVLETMQP